MFKQTEKIVESRKRKLASPRYDNKAMFNFKVKKSDHVLKQNVVDKKNHSDEKIDKERLKDITATLKSVEKQVDTKISSNSLIASIQDGVMKNAPLTTASNGDHKSPKHCSVEKRDVKHTRTAIIRQYDINSDHGEDKIILHLEKNRKKPDHCHIVIQTDNLSEIVNVGKEKEKELKKNILLVRKRNDSDMSMSSKDNSVCVKKFKSQKMSPPKTEEKITPSNSRQHRRELPRSQSKENRSRSRGHGRKRSHSRNRSRSRGPFRCYKRSDSPYRRNRRSRTRSPYRSTRHSPSVWRDYYSTRTKKRLSPQYNVTTEKKIIESFTPPIVFVGRLEKDLSKAELRSQFIKFGPVTEVRLHSKEDGSRYGFVTYQRPRDAWSAVEAASSFPQYDVGFGGRRTFCRQSYVDLDGLEAKYTESAFHGQAAMPIRRNDDLSFEQMLLDLEKKLN